MFQINVSVSVRLMIALLKVARRCRVPEPSVLFEGWRNYAKTFFFFSSLKNRNGKLSVSFRMNLCSASGISLIGRKDVDYAIWRDRVFV